MYSVYGRGGLDVTMLLAVAAATACAVAEAAAVEMDGAGGATGVDGGTTGDAVVRCVVGRLRLR